MADNFRLDELLDRLHATQKDLEQEFDRLLRRRRKEFKYQLRRGRVVFEKNMRRLQRQYRTGLWQYLTQANLLTVLTAPIIYAMVVPLMLVDVTFTFYQHICFRVYRIPRVRRRDHVVIDRHHLAYLNAVEKLNCVYCGYGNGVIAYAREITARTEQYWCPIRHARRTPDPHHRVERFIDYGDAEGWREKLPVLREDWEQADGAGKTSSD